MTYWTFQYKVTEFQYEIKGDKELTEVWETLEVKSKERISHTPR